MDQEINTASHVVMEVFVVHRYLIEQTELVDKNANCMGNHNEYNSVHIDIRFALVANCYFVEASGRLMIHGNCFFEKYQGPVVVDF